jgi:DNA primase
VPYIAEKSIHEVEERLDAVSIVREYTNLDKKGNRWWACCPFHNEKTPSFTVNPETKTFLCFGCGKGGSIISLVMEMDKLNFPEAIEKLAKKSGVHLEYEQMSAGDADRRREEDKARDSLYELYRRVAGSFHHLLLKTEEGRSASRYLRERGMSDETIDAFNLGYTPRDRAWLHKFLSEKSWSQEMLSVSGLFSSKYPQSAFFSQRLMFPISDREGRICAFGGRILEGDGPKYINSGENPIYHKGKTLYALHHAINSIRQTRTALICEGYMDCLALHQAGLTNAVAPLGTAFTEEQARLLRSWAERLVFFFDTDKAGQAAAEKAILLCLKTGLGASVIVPDSGNLKDPADILKEYGAETLKNTEKFAILDLEYLVRRARINFDLASASGKARAAAWFFPSIEALEGAVARDAWFSRVSEALLVDRKSLEEDFQKRGQRDSGRQRPETKVQAEKKPHLSRLNYELYLMTLVFVNPSLFKRLRAELSLDEIRDREARMVYLALEEWFRETGGEAGQGLPHELIEKVREDDLRAWLLRESASEVYFHNTEEQLEDSLRNSKQKALEQRCRDIDLELARRDIDQREREALLQEKIAIQGSKR